MRVRIILHHRRAQFQIPRERNVAFAHVLLPTLGTRKIVATVVIKSVRNILHFTLSVGQEIVRIRIVVERDQGCRRAASAGCTRTRRKRARHGTRKKMKRELKTVWTRLHFGNLWCLRCFCGGGGVISVCVCVCLCCEKCIKIKHT